MTTRGKLTEVPFTLAELAGRLGHKRDWLTRDDDKNLKALYAAGLPPPLSPVGRRLWDRKRTEAWLQRRTLQPGLPANDEFETAPAETVEQERAELRLVYGGNA